MTQTPAEGNSSFVLMLRIAFVATPVWIRCPRHEQTGRGWPDIRRSEDSSGAEGEDQGGLCSCRGLRTDVQRRHGRCIPSSQGSRDSARRKDGAANRTELLRRPLGRLERQDQRASGQASSRTYSGSLYVSLFVCMGLVWLCVGLFHCLSVRV